MGPLLAIWMSLLAAAALSEASFIFRCASEHGTYSCLGEVRYGKEPVWTAWRTAFGSVGCNSEEFKDPALDEEKICQCIPATVS